MDFFFFALEWMKSLSQLHFVMLEPGVTERVHITLLCSNTRFADLDLILGNVSPPFMFKANYLLAQKTVVFICYFQSIIVLSYFIHYL